MPRVPRGRNTAASLAHIDRVMELHGYPPIGPPVAPVASTERDDTSAAPSTTTASSSNATKQTEATTKTAAKPKNWSEVELEVAEDGEIPVYDDCNDIRRKIRALQQESGFKITTWLKEIGNVNNNSYQRFMKASGPTGGAENGTYYCAYIYFEKRRVLEGKKKTAKRIRSEDEFPLGRPLQDDRRVKYVWARK